MRTPSFLSPVCLLGAMVAASGAAPGGAQDYADSVPSRPAFRGAVGLPIIEYRPPGLGAAVVSFQEPKAQEEARPEQAESTEGGADGESGEEKQKDKEE